MRSWRWRHRPVEWSAPKAGTPLLPDDAQWSLRWHPRRPLVAPTPSPSASYPRPPDPPRSREYSTTEIRLASLWSSPVRSWAVPWRIEVRRFVLAGQAICAVDKTKWFRLTKFDLRTLCQTNDWTVLQHWTLRWTASGCYSLLVNVPFFVNHQSFLSPSCALSTHDIWLAISHAVWFNKSLPTWSHWTIINTCKR